MDVDDGDERIHRRMRLSIVCSSLWNDEGQAKSGGQI